MKDVFLDPKIFSVRAILLQTWEKTHASQSDAVFIKSRPFDDVRFQRIVDFGYQLEGEGLKRQIISQNRSERIGVHCKPSISSLGGCSD